MQVFVAMIALIGLVVNPVLVSAQAAEEAAIKLPSGKSYKVTRTQVESLKTQPGIQFSETLPAEIAKGNVAVAIPEELGGGYLIGTSQAIAVAFNTVGITVGLTAAAISGMDIGIGVTLASVIGAIAGALAADDDNHTAPSHHAASSHH